MKNFKIYKSAIALLTSASILLLSGCTGANTETAKEKKEKTCTHLTVYFEDETITFKECHGYDISIERYGKSSEIEYKITKDNNKIISGVTTMYNKYDVYHSIADEQIDIESVQKSK